jgi:hypothetical protein
VQHLFHPPIPLAAWPSDDHRTRLVLITRDIDEEWLRNTLTLFDIDGHPAMLSSSPIAETPSDSSP